MNQLFSIFALDKSGTLFSDQNGKVFNDYIHYTYGWMSQNQLSDSSWDMLFLLARLIKL